MTEGEDAAFDADDISSEDLDDEVLPSSANLGGQSLSGQADYVGF